MPRSTMARSGVTSERSVKRAAAPEERTVSPGRWPELRIVRQVNFDTHEAYDWSRFINEVGSRNYGAGTAKCLGSMACNFVDAQSMGRMMAKKYRKASGDRKRTLQVQRSFARDFNQFVRGQERIRIDARFEKQTAPKLKPRFPDPMFEAATATDLWDEEDNPEGVIFIPDIEPEMPADAEEMRWNEGVFAVKAIDKFGHNDLGLDLSPNEQLYKEEAEIRDYLRHEGLDINHLRDGPEGRFSFQPHASFFETYGAAGSVALSYTVEMPEGLPLHPPVALVTRF
jgi:hypothetical protein